jgi:deoxyribodipyrimidine photo-lyase
VFTPYWRRWRDVAGLEAQRRPRSIYTVDRVASDGIPDGGEPTATAWRPEPGERAARRALDRFLAGAPDRYRTQRDQPAGDGTSRLGPYLKFGCIHPRQILSRLDLGDHDHETFAKELAWRDFYADVLYARPDSAWDSFDRRLAAIELDDDSGADDLFAAWTEGRTGFPIVDAGMRQLVAEGYMHNRVRMIVASVLVKDFHLDWTRGARFFLEHLYDGDLASNSHGWQWVAGTGTDAAPYFRVFNPARQGERFDPDGAYVRRWVPELGGVAGAHIHDPEAHGVRPPAYPAPVVDHGAERREALRRYHAATRP